MKIQSIIMAMASVFVAQAVFADDIRLGVPQYGGTGCPAGTASATLSPDAKSISILFDQYVAESGGQTGKTVDRKSCNVTIPVHVPQGYSISVFAVDYRGFNALPSGASSQFNVEYFFAGAQGPRYSKRFFGAQSQDFLISNKVIAESLVWSACGVDTILRTNSSLVNYTNVSRDQTLSSVDSADVEAGIVYQIQWKRCN